MLEKTSSVMISSVLAACIVSTPSAIAQCLWRPKAPLVYPTISSPQAAAAGDMNGDGIVDLIVAGKSPNGGIAVHLGVGRGVFLPMIAKSIPQVTSVKVADLNGDGKLDVVAARRLQAWSEHIIMVGLGDGSFSEPVFRILADRPTYPEAIVIADFNGDGRADLAIANRDNATSRISVMLGDGTAGFSPPLHYAVPASLKELATADMNNDGCTDIVSCSSAGKSVSVLLSNCDGTLQAPTNYALSNFEAITLAAADLNADGWTDIAVACRSIVEHVVWVFKGAAGGILQPTFQYSHNIAGPEAIIAVDMNGDRLLDLISATTPLQMAYLLGKDDHSFNEACTYPGGTSITAFVAANVNNDRRQDLVALSGGSSTFAVFTTEYCVADFVENDEVNEHDLYAFLTQWFGRHVAADINGSQTITVQDLFDFLGRWFSGC